MRVKPDSIVNGFDASFYLLSNPDVAASGIDPLVHFMASGWKEGRMPDGLFDVNYYLTNNPDIAAAGINPLTHYLASGAAEGRDPSALFDTSAYLAANPDVAAAGANPLQHYLEFGIFEGRAGGAVNTTGTAGNDYLIGTAGADIINAGTGNDFVTALGGDDVVDGGAGTDTVRFAGNFTAYTITVSGNTVTVDGPEGHDVFTNFERFAFKDGTIVTGEGNPLVDDLYYYANNKDVWTAGVDAAQHFAQYGAHEGRNPDQYFDTAYYLAQNPDVAAAGVDPFQHYLTYGWLEGRNPSALFDTKAYLAANPDVAAAHINPLVHFLAHGESEGRSPEGTVQTSVTGLEDHDTVFATADFSGAASAASVTIDATGVAHGTLFLDANDNNTIDSGETLSGSGNVVAVSDIGAGRLHFRPAANANGADYATFGYVAGSSTPGAMHIDITAVNDAPAGSDKTVTALEDSSYALTAGDFGFSDPVDGANSLLAVKITTLPGAGTLTNNGSAVSAGSTVTVADINAGHLLFTPAANASGNAYASFTFQVQDDGGTANGGIDLDPSANTITVNVSAVNDAPAGTDKTVTTPEETGYTFAASDFGFSDATDSPANTLAAVRITSLPGSGVLKDNGVAVTAGQFVTVADINANKLVFTPAANANGAAAASFTFQVQDNGGTANGGVDLDPSANTITVNVTSVNDAPSGADKTVTTLEDTGYTFSASDFGFTDLNDTAPNSLLAVKITTLPGSGTLADNGVAVTTGAFVPVADITGGHLVFTPALNANGATNASFTFQVQDGGGTAGSGVDLDASPNTITVNVTAVNDAPAGTDNTLTINEDTPHTFSAADFGFTDPADAAPNSLLAVEITTLPTHGTLTLDTGSGPAAVTAHQFIAASDIGGLVFTPDQDANGNAYASFTFQVQDNGGTANSGANLDASPNTISFNVTPVDDAPNQITFTQSIALPEGSLGGTAVGTVQAHDPDAGATITFALVNQDGTAYSGPFAIDQNSGAITVAPGADANTIDFEATDNGTIDVIVRATDNTGLHRDQAISINIADVFESNLQAIEGYIANAQIFVDGNDNGQYDAGEYTVTSDAFGGFKIVGDHGSHDIYLLGGGSAVDTATGLAFNGILRAPAGSTVLSPLTTLIATLVAGGASVATATTQVATALSLDPSVDYTTYDPVVASLNGDTNGDAAFAAGVQVYNTVVQASSLLSGAGADSAGAAAAVVGAIAQQIQAAAAGSSTVSLSDGTTLGSVINSAASQTSTTVPSQTVTDATQIISNTNGAVQTAVDNASGLGALKAVAGAATVAQGDAATALHDAAANNTSPDTTQYSGTNLDNKVGVATAQVSTADVTGPNADKVLTGTADVDVLTGAGGNDTLFGGAGKDILTGGAGNDTLYGDVLTAGQATRDFAFDRADYSAASGPITVHLGAGTVTGDVSVGSDTLVSIEGIIGSNFADSYDASDYSATSTNNGGVGYTYTTGIGAIGTLNQFEGKGGDDTIKGNGNTRVSYQSAAGGVTVNLQTGVVNGDASVGHDTIVSGVNAVRGSEFNDTITGRGDNGNTPETFEGLGGDDIIDGQGGFDRARYDLENTGASGIVVNLGAGTVTGGDAAAIAVVGHDTLQNIESIRGSQSADVYDASTYSLSSTNHGGSEFGTFNEFEGLAGNDTITGNGNTRVAYYNATAAVTVQFTAFGVGSATGDASVGIDTFVSGVTFVRGSNFDDTLIGSNNGLSNIEQFDGWAGNDFIDGGLGLDRARYDGNNGVNAGMPLGAEGMDFNLALGTATARDAAALFNYGNDTLRGIEMIRGTDAHDTYTAAGFSASSQNAGGNGTFNEFEGGLGNDDITGNGNTRISYQNASGAVTVNLGTSSTSGAAGNDILHGGINAVRGSNFGDMLIGSDNASNTTELFEGMGGDDTINGGANTNNGFDIARYDTSGVTTAGINIVRGAGGSTVTGLDAGAIATVGTDTLINIEGVRGTNLHDVYNATGFAGFNEFEGMGGDDDITGSGNTRITYANATGSVSVNLSTNSVTGAAGNDTLHGGINAVRGSNFNDTIVGTAGAQTFTGNAGSDTFVFHAGFGLDTITDFTAGTANDDVIQFDHTMFADFNAVMAASVQTSPTVVTITLDANDKVTLQNVTLANLHANDFLIV